jgi:hypothetical protein
MHIHIFMSIFDIGYSSEVDLIHIYTYICICIHTNKCIYIVIGMLISVMNHKFWWIHSVNIIYMNMYIHIWICVYIYIYLYIHNSYTHIYINIYIYKIGCEVQVTFIGKVERENKDGTYDIRAEVYMYMFIYVYVCIHKWCMYGIIHIYYIHTFMYMHTFIYINIYKEKIKMALMIFGLRYECIYLFMYVCIFTFIYNVCMYIYMYDICMV